MRILGFTLIILLLLFPGLTGRTQTTSVVKTYQSSGSIVFGAGVTTVNVSMWGGGGGGSAGGMKEYTNSTDYYLHYGAGGGGSSWAGGSFTPTAGVSYPFTVGSGGAAGGLDGNGNPMSGGNGTKSQFQTFISYGGYGGTISGFHAYGGPRSANPTPDPGLPYAGNGADESSSQGGNGGRSNNGAYGPSAAIVYSNYSSGQGYPAGFGWGTGVPGLRPGDGGGGGGYTILPLPLNGLAERIPGGAGANGVVTFYISYPTYRLTAAPTASRLCGSGSSLITLNSSALSAGYYTVTYNTTNPATSGNTVSMYFNAGTGSFSTIPLSNTSTITITNLASGNTSSDAITVNNQVTVIVDNAVPFDWNPQIDFAGTARSRAATFTIGDKAYIGTGKTGTTLLRDFWQFDPATNAWTQLADFGGTARSGAVGMGIGTKGYIGTGSDAGGDKTDLWEYDPFTNVWTAKASLPGSPRSNAAAMTIGARGYLGTGVMSSGGYLYDFWSYDPQTNTWTARAPFAGGGAGSGRSGAVAFAIDSKGYMGTGYNGSSYSNDFWEYDPAANTWTQRPSLPGAGRSGAAGFRLAANGYIGTGWTGSSNLNDFYVYEPAFNRWTTSNTFPGVARSFASGFAIGNRAYMGLGEAGSNVYRDFYEYTAYTGIVKTGALPGSAFCTGSSFAVPFSTGTCAGGFEGGNQFVAQLSDSLGSFANPVAIGSVSSATGSIPVTIPAGAVAGSRYRIRVVGSAPLTIGNDNGSNFAIKPAVAVTVVAGIDKTSICRGDSVRLTATLSTPATTDTTVLLHEDFNSGAPSWLLTNSNSYPYGEASIYTNGQSGLYSNDNSAFYYTNSSGRFANDVTNTTLQSPMFSTLGVNGVTLTFYHQYQYGGYHNSDSIRVLASIDNGATWSTVYLNNTATEDDAQDSLGFVKKTFSLSAFSNQPSLVLRFNYGAYGGMGRWLIDNIEVKGISKANNFAWTSSPAGFTSTLQNPTGVVPISIPGSTVYTVAYTNRYGCGSVSNSVSVNVKDTSGSTTALSLCPSQLPYSWNDLSLSAAGTYRKVLVNAAGCDSTARLVLSLKPVSASTTTISICPSDLPYTWNGLQFTTAGAQTAHFTNSVGCDSAATLNLVVKAASTYTVNLTICESSLPYVWNNMTLTAAGSVTAHLTNAVGCDSAATLNLSTVPSVAAVTASATFLCAGTSITLGASAGSGATVTVLKEGFNSTHNNWTKINQSSGGLVDSAAWTLRPNNYEPYFGTPAFRSNDNSQFYMTNSYAQGPGVTTQTILQSPAFSTMGLTAATLTLYHQFTHQNSFANDSIRVQVSTDGTSWTNLYVNKTTTVGSNMQFQLQTIGLSSYLNQPALRLRFVYNGTPLPGGYSNYWWLIDNVSVTGTIAPSTFSWSSTPAGFTSTQQNPGSVTPTQTTTYTVAVNNGFCSATRSVLITMNTTNPSSVTNLSICPSSLPYTWNGLVFTGAGTQTAHITTPGNCDSSATLNLAVRPQASSVTNLTICPSGLPYTWNGLVFTAAGSQTKLFPTGASCDSAATLNLTVQSSSSSSVTTLSICPDQLPYTWNGLVFTTAGTQAAVLTNRYGCDSTATLNLLLSTKPTISSAAASLTSVCAGATTNLSAAATAGTVLLDENFNSGAVGWTTTNLSTGGTPALAAWTIRQSGYVSPLGLTFRSNDNTALYLSSSRDQGVGTVTNTYLQSPLFSTVGYSALSLTFYHHYVSSTNDSIRVQVSTDYGATWTRVYVRSTSIQGSSSNFQLQTIALDGYVNNPAVMIRFHYGASYDYYWTLDNVKVTGTALPLTYSWSSTPSGFNSGLQNPTGVAVTQSTVYNLVVSSAQGCSETASVPVVVKAATSSVTNLSVCPAELPYTWNQLSFTTAGSQTAHLLNSIGCDSAATLNLTLKPAPASSASVSVCPGSFPYTFGGLLFNGPGTQSVSYPGSNGGCDSTASFTVSLKAASSSTTTMTLCTSALPYSWNGLSFTAAGSQTAHLVNSVGCDSAATLTLTTIASPAAPVVTASATTICQGSSINLSATASSSGVTRVVLSEGFNGTVNSWTKINNSTGGNTAAAAWTLTPTGSLSSNDASQFYLSNSDAQGSGTTTKTVLQSPAFSTVGLSSASLQFYHYYRHSGSEIRVEVSTDGVTWTSLYQNNSGDVGQQYAFAQQTVSLNSYLNQAALRVRFSYTASWGWYWAIDNVTVSGAELNPIAWTSSPAGFTSSLQNPSGLQPAVTTTYTATSSNAQGCSASGSVVVNVTPTPSATITYGFSSNCISGGTASVTQTGTTGGVYRAPAGLALDAATGAVTLSASTPGTYTVTYSIAAGSCPAYSSTGSITINPNYTITATAGSHGSISPSGTSNVCAQTGTTYTITADACSSIADVLVDGVSVGAVSTYTFADISANHTISASFTAPATTATISYPGSPYCGTGTAQPTLTGAQGGVYSSTPGIVLNAATGVVDLAASTAGTYTVTYSVSGGCGAGSSTATLVINDYSTWTGAMSRDWNNPGNWCGALPTASSDVLIPAVANLPVIYGGAAGDVRNLTVQAGTSLTVLGTLNLFGNLVNNGGSLQMSNGGLDLEGSNPQTVPAFTVQMLHVNGGGGFTLSGNSTVSGTLTFGTAGGYVLLGSYNLTVGSVAGGDAGGFVVTNGTGALIRKALTGTQLMPVGVSSGSYTPLSITSSDGLDWAVRLQANFSGYPAVNAAAALPRIWHITPTQSPTPTPATLVFTYPDAFWTTPPSVTVFRYHAATGGWNPANNNASGLPAVLAGSLRSVTLTGQQGFSPFALSGSSAPLPVTLLDFSAQASGRNNELTWHTATEQMSRGFEVQRSYDGQIFQAIGFVASRALNGNSTAVLGYGFHDSSFGGPRQFYRLRQLDLDGHSHYSAVRIVSRAAMMPRMTLYPNPAGREAFLLLAVPADGNYSIRIVDGSGKTVRILQRALTRGEQQLLLPLEDLANGTYWVQAQDAAGKQLGTVPLVKR